MKNEYEDHSCQAGQPSESPSSASDSPYLATGSIPRILVLTRKGHMSKAAMNYALNVAERMNYALLAVYVNTLPLYRDGGIRSRRFDQAVGESSQLFKDLAAKRAVAFSHISEAGKITRVVQRLSQAIKRIEFMVVDKDIRLTDVTAKSPVPVFSVMHSPRMEAQEGCDTGLIHNKHGERTMKKNSRTRYFKRCLIFGVGVVALYAAVFSKADLVINYFTRGGVYALLPVATVFLFSYMHGSFTSSFWSALGIEGSNKTAVSQAEKRAEKTDTVGKRKDTRPRAQLSL